MSDIDSFLSDYETYSSLFAKQIYNKDMWEEQTGCNTDEYFEYIECCGSRLYDFKVWYEHTTGKEYPTGGKWDKYLEYKTPILDFHP